jgi:O-antigen/teichoic acid export membrane protein
VSRDAAASVVGRFALGGIVLVTDVALARLLGPADKGRFTLILLFTQLLALGLGMGLDRAIGVAVARSRDVARRAIGNAVLWTLLAGGIGVVIVVALGGRGPARTLASVLPVQDLPALGLAAIAVPLEVAFNLGLLSLLGRRRIIAYSAVRLLRRSVLLVGIATAALIAVDLRVALACNVLALAACGVAAVIVARRDGILGVRPSLPLLREQLAFGARSVTGTFAERLQFRVDAFLVAALIGVGATGVYSVAAALGEVLWYIPTALGAVVFSRAVALDGDPGATTGVLTRLALAIGTLCALPVLVAAPWIVELLYGPAFAAAGDALRILLPGLVAYGAAAVLLQYALGVGAPGRYTGVLIAGLVVNVTANIVLVPRLGLVGAAAASSISYFVTALFAVWLFSRLSGRPWQAAVVLRRGDLSLVRDALRRAVRRGGRHLPH